LTEKITENFAMTKGNAKTIIRIILPYILFGSLWILLSDRILARIVQDPAARTQWSIYKGWAYVFITGLLLTALLSRVLRSKERAFDALLESERRFFHIFHKNPLSIAITRQQDDCYLDINDSYTNLTGFKKEEVIGRTPYELNLWVDPDQRKRFINQIKEKQRLSGIELEVRNKQGEKIPILFSAELIDLAGEPCMISMGQDITERKRADSELLLSRQRLDQHVKHTPLGVIEFEADGLIRAWNSAATNLFGYSEEEAVGQHRHLLTPPSAIDMAEEIWKRLLLREGGTRSTNHNRTKDGRIISCEWFNTPLVDAKGITIGVASLVMDVTERLQAIETIQEHRNTLTTLFNSVPNVLMLINKNCLIEDINNAGIAFSGRKKDRLIDHVGGEVFGCLNASNELGCGRNPDCAECPIRARVTQTFNTKQPIYNDEGCMTILRGKARLTIHFLISTSLVSTRDKELVLVSLTDITRLKKSEEEREHLWNQLNQVQKMEAIGQLAGGVAHDFNNILNAMMLRIECLQEASLSEPEAEEAMKDFKKDIHRAAGLTRQLLLFGRKQLLQIDTLDLNDVAANILKMLRRLLRENINLILESSPAPIWIEADHGMMEQVIMNLCINAQDAMPDGGNLLLSIHKIKIDEAHANANPESSVGEFACIKVSDQGSGIDAATLTHIFEPFFTTKEVGKGTGLGLATVHGIVKQHGGWVEVESTVGKGSIFCVYLQLSSQIPTQHLAEPAILAKAQKSGTILIIEDEANLRSMSAKVLELYGYHVIEAANASEALACWEEHAGSIDLLFTDMVMPGTMNGLELSKYLQVLKPGLKVVISSGYSNGLLSQPHLQSQDIHYIPKPYDAKKLIQAIDALL
jgi:PAS domain S-box-containing protein